MAEIDGGDAYSTFTSAAYPNTTVCIPDLAVIWPDPTVLPDPYVDPENPTSDELTAWLPYEIAVELAWTSLQTLTAYQLALCPVVVRPCKKSCSEGSYFIAPVDGYGPGRAPFYPSVSAGVWTNVWCGHTDGCSCTTVREVILPGPVGAVVEVRIDGDVLEASAYRVDNSNRLVRQDGEGWPACQDMNAPAGAAGTFTVEYYRGAVADRTVLWAVGMLADELAKSINGDETCRLPAGTTAVSRQGITIEIQNNLFEDGVTGIPEIDAVIARFNPFRQKMPSAIFSLDRPNARQTTWQ